MILGRVTGTLWGARQAEALGGSKVLLVRPLSAAGEPESGEIVALDQLAAGPGDLVLVGIGSRVRDLTLGASVPTKAVVLAIVDDVAREP
jgi:ethanolamine utilization protein EutN